MAKPMRPKPPAARRPPRPKAPPRKITTLSLKATDYAVLVKLAEMENCSIHEVIRRSTQMRYKAHMAALPELMFPKLKPEDLPEAEFMAYVGVKSGRVRAFEIA
jgi:hypothetical protein